jgi:hypothetical protein
VLGIWLTLRYLEETTIATDPGSFGWAGQSLAILMLFDFTGAFRGRLGRSIQTDNVRAANSPQARHRRLIPSRREAGQRAGDIHRMQVWAGQSAAFARPEPAAEFVRRLWAEAEPLLSLAE